MNAKEAREIVTQFKEGRFIFDDVHPNAKAYFLAEGFLEASKAAELLLKAIEKVTEDDYCLNPSFTNSLNAYGDDVIEDVIPCETCEVCKLRDALEKYKKEVLGE